MRTGHLTITTFVDGIRRSSLRKHRRSSISIFFCILIITTSFAGCFGDSLTKSNTDSPTLLTENRDGWIKADLFLRTKVITSGVHTDVQRCHIHDEVGATYNVDWWLDPISSGADTAPDAELVDESYVDTLGDVPRMVINGIPYLGTDRPKLFVPDESTRGFNLLRDIGLCYLVGIPSIPTFGDVMYTLLEENLMYIAPLEFTFTFKDSALSRLFGEHVVTVPFPIQLPPCDGKNHEVETEHRISMLMPVWSLLEHVVNVQVRAGMGKLTADFIRTRNVENAIVAVNIPIIDPVLRLLQNAYRVLCVFAARAYYSDPCRPHDSAEDQFDIHLDWTYNKHYDWNYMINSL